MKIIEKLKLGHLTLTLAHGDIFESPVEAIVNSEQTDFRLSRGGKSLSGQIWTRFGPAIQRELDECTQGQRFRAGTVLKTSGGAGFKAIFHAGFHDPAVYWAGMQDEANAVYFEAVGSCVRQVLGQALSSGIKSVAFPLIGCGLFGLNERLLISQFIDVIDVFSKQANDDAGVDVWLVIRDPQQLDAVLGQLLTDLMEARIELARMELPRTGFEPLDRFAALAERQAGREWMKWQLCRYAELAAEVVLSGVLASLKDPPPPESLFRDGAPVAFGIIREGINASLQRGALAPSTREAEYLVSLATSNDVSKALDKLNQERNNLAHGRRTSDLDEIRELVLRRIRMEEWKDRLGSSATQTISAWSPWVKRIDKGGVLEIGLFERWQGKKFRYLIPDTGEVFNLPRSNVLD